MCSQFSNHELKCILKGCRYYKLQRGGGICGYEDTIVEDSMTSLAGESKNSPIGATPTTSTSSILDADLGHSPIAQEGGSNTSIVIMGEF